MIAIADTHRPVLVDGARGLWVVKGPEFETRGLDYDSARAVLAQVGWADWEIALVMEAEAIEEFIQSAA